MNWDYDLYSTCCLIVEMSLSELRAKAGLSGAIYIIGWNGDATLITHYYYYPILSLTMSTLDDTRTRLLGASSDPPSSLASSSISLIHSIPRSNGAPKYLAKYSDPEVHDYVQGIIGPIILPLVFAAVTLLFYLIFVIGRGCFDSMGKRYPTRKYTKKEVNVLRGFLALTTSICIVLFVIGLTSNSAISRTVDKAFITSDALVDYGFSYTNPFQAISDTSLLAASTVKALNASVYSTTAGLNDAVISSGVSCIGNSVAILALQTPLLAELSSLNYALSNLTAPAIQYNMTVQLAQAQSIINNFPSLSAVISAAAITNNSLAPSRNLTTLAFQLSELSNAYQAFASHSTAYSSVSALQSALDDSVNTAQNNYQYNSSSLEKELDNLDSALALLPDLNVLTTEIQTNSGVKAQLINALNQTKTAVLNIPTLSIVVANLTNLNNIIQALQITTTLSPLLHSIRQSLASLVNINLVKTQLTDLQANSNNIQSTLGPLITALTNIESAASNFPELLLTTQLIHQATLGLSQLRGYNYNIFDSYLIQYNSSVNELSCLGTVLQQISAVNQSLVTFGNEVQSVLQKQAAIDQQINNIDRIHRFTDESYNTSHYLRASINSTGSLTAVDQLATPILASLSLLPNVTQAIVDVMRLQNYLQNLPSFTNIKNDLTSLASSTASISSAAINQLDDEVIAVLTAIQALSTRVSNEINLLTQLDLTLTNLPQLLSYAIGNFSSDPSNSPIISEPPRSSLLSKLNRLKAYSLFHIPFASFITQAQALTNNLPSNSLISNAQTTLNQLASAYNFTDTAGVHYQINSISGILYGPSMSGISTQHQAFRSLQAAFQSSNQKNFTQFSQNVNTVTNHYVSRYSFNLLISYNATNYTVIQTLVTPLDFGNLSRQLTAGSNVMSTAQGYLLANGLTAVAAITPYLPDMQATVDSLTLGADALASGVRNLTNTRHRYLVTRQKVKRTMNGIDGLRLLAFILILLLPLVLLSFTIYSAVRLRGKCSLMQATGFFPIIAALFVFAGIQLIPAIFVADQCSGGIDPFIKNTLLSNYQLVGNGSQIQQIVEWLNVTQQLSGIQFYDYLTACDGNRPQLLTALDRADSTSLPTNTTRYRQGIVDAISNANTETAGGLMMSGSLSGYFDVLDQCNNQIVNATHTLGRLTQCDQSKVVHDNWVNSVCGSNALAGALGLNTVVFFLLGLCMWPGIIYGILGWKRFQLDNIIAQAKEVADSKYAAKLQEVEINHAQGNHLHGAALGAAAGAIALGERRVSVAMGPQPTPEQRPRNASHQAEGDRRMSEAHLGHYSFAHHDAPPEYSPEGVEMANVNQAPLHGHGANVQASRRFSQAHIPSAAAVQAGEPVVFNNNSAPKRNSIVLASSPKAELEFVSYEFDEEEVPPPFHH
jgi:hypothetical protein